ncbi:MAG: hypothetical protein ACXVDW_16480, partial [Bacteroidia bacterium]
RVSVNKNGGSCLGAFGIKLKETIEINIRMVNMIFFIKEIEFSEIKCKIFMLKLLLLKGRSQSLN